MITKNNNKKWVKMMMVGVFSLLSPFSSLLLTSCVFLLLKVFKADITSSFIIRALSSSRQVLRFAAIQLKASLLFSTKTASLAPLLTASMPMAPLKVAWMVFKYM